MIFVMVSMATYFVFSHQNVASANYQIGLPDGHELANIYEDFMYYSAYEILYRCSAVYFIFYRNDNTYSLGPWKASTQLYPTYIF